MSDIVKSYSWRNGSRYSVPAATFASVISSLEAEQGAVTPEAVVNTAKSSSSPIHSMFCWDDSKAADNYRKEQARAALRSLRVVVSYRESTIQGPRIAYVSVHKEKARGYVNTQEVMADVTMRDEAVQLAKKSFLALRERYNHLRDLSKELEEIFGVMDSW